MDYEITLLRKDQYGRVVYHPVCDKAKTFALIAGTKTLTLQALHNIKLLGYKLIVKHEEEVV
jgi:hypothetical protein